MKMDKGKGQDQNKSKDSNKSKDKNNSKDRDTNIDIIYWGEVDCRPVYLYKLRNKKGLEACITNYGGIITSLRVPAGRGEMVDIVLGFDNLKGYLDDHPYLGAIIGRYANRIGGGRFTLDGFEYILPCNEAANHLHGGFKGFDKRVWNAKAVRGENAASLILSLYSSDGEEGYPGNLAVTVTYTLTPENELKLDYCATADQATIINLTNHSYFNLTGGKENILGHQLLVKASYYTETGPDLIPTGSRLPVDGSPYDFRKPRLIGERIQSDYGQLKKSRGYDVNYVLDGSGELDLAAVVREPSSDISFEVYTDQPGVQLYTGNYLTDISGKGGNVYRQYWGVCLETQHYPDSINQPVFPSTVLRQGEIYQTTTVYKFIFHQSV